MITILLVDDDIDLRARIIEAMHSIPAVVLEAADATAGLKLARIRRADLVLCDLNHQSEFEWQMLAAFHAERETADIPIILMTDSAVLPTGSCVSDWGPNEVLRKPFTDEELIAAVMVHLRKHEVSRAESGRALRESESRFQAIADAALDAIILMDPDGRISFWNPAAARTFGYSASEAVGQTLHELIVPKQYRAAHSRAFPIFEDSGQGAALGRTLELTALRKDGVEFPVELSLSAVLLDGRWNAVGIVRDITERKRAEEAMRRSETKYRSLYNSTGDAVMLLDKNGFIDCNEAALAMFGCSTRERFCLMHPADLSPPMQPDGTDSLTVADRHIASTTEKGGHCFEWLYRRADTGQTFLAEVLLTVMELDGRSVFQAVARDISGRHRAEDRLRQLSRAVEQSPASIIITDTMGRIEYVNPCFERVTGFCAAEVIGQNPRVLKSGEQPAEFHRTLWRTIQAGQDWAGEFRNRKKNGEHFWEQASISPVRDHDARITHFVAVKQDITERKRMEKELHREQEFARTLVDNISEGVVACDVSGKLVLFNRTAREWHGMDALALPPEEWSRHYHLHGPDGTTPLATELVPLVRALRGEIVPEFELSIVANGQPPRHLLATGRPFFDSEQTMLGAVVVLRDITDRKRGETALRESEEQFRAMFELASIGMGKADPMTGQWLRVNHKLCAITGYSAEELLHLSVFDITHAADRQTDLEAFQRVVRGEIPDYRLEKRYVRKDGLIAWVSVNTTVLRDAAGQPIKTMSTIEDITERKRLEQERTQMELQLRHSQKLQAIGHLAAGISHEINTPVQFIGDNTRFIVDIFGGVSPLLDKCAELIEAGRRHCVTPELLAECDRLWAAADVDYLRNEVPAALGQTLEGVERIGRIVRAMKDFSHPGTDEKVLVDLNKLIESTLTVSRNEWKYVADLCTDFDLTLTAVPCLPGEFNQVILNLVVNAAHAIADALGAGTKRKGTLTVLTRRTEGWAEVSIADTGTGIPEAVRSHIFEPFFTTKEVGRGTGQGLAIAHAVITDKHGGTIHFETTVGQGTTFIIRLPLTTTPIAKEAGAPNAHHNESRPGLHSVAEEVPRCIAP